MENDTQPRKYVLLDVIDGIEHRQYENGDIRNQYGHMLAPLKGGNEIITSETARTYQQLRKQKILNAIEKRVMDVTRTNVPYDAIAHIVGKRAEIAMKDETRTGNEAAKIVLQAMDAYQPKQEETRTNVLRHEYTMDDETRALLERIVRERRTSVLDMTDAQGTDDYTKESQEE